MEKNSKEKNNILTKLKQFTTQNAFSNLVCASTIAIYFIFFNKIRKQINTEMFLTYIHITSILFLVLTILIFEKAYKEDNDSIALNGIEFLIVSIFTLLIQYIPKVLNINETKYILIGACLFIVYYAIKNILIYTKEKKAELDKFSDIKEIVKNEPIKKQTKRKNKKEE